MNRINWGIIGCGDVTEIKSGPAFSKVDGSALVAVMRRNAVKAEDYARRHDVASWYTDAALLINDPGVDAVYIATPPSSHEEYTLAAIAAGKPVYVEKPMSLDVVSAKRMADAAVEKNVKLSVAHYRREWPMFKKIKQLLTGKIIGEVQNIRLEFDRLPFGEEELADEQKAWRVNPAISGGGLFNDLAPHQLDIMYWLFGDAQKIAGNACNNGGHYEAADTVTGNILFANGIEFNGNWNFNAAGHKDHCEITGKRGKIRFSFFSRPGIELNVHGQVTQLSFEPLLHVQQPMIARVVKFFSGNGTNPCSGEEGVMIMHWIDTMTGK